jgi:hypothetical protein
MRDEGDAAGLSKLELLAAFSVRGGLYGPHVWSTVRKLGCRYG